MFTPNAAGFSLSSVSAALGQVFYSLSLCMGITITYGSYLKKGENIFSSCGSVAVMDTLMAVLAGIAIFPAVFAFGLQPDSGPSLIFSTLPKVFGSLRGGPVFALAFFALVFFAAGHQRHRAAGGACQLRHGQLGPLPQKGHAADGRRGVPVGRAQRTGLRAPGGFAPAGYNFFDLMGLLTDNILLPLGGILMCWFIGWKWKPQLLAWEIEDGCPKFGRVAKVWIGCIRFLVPVMILIVTVTGFMGIFEKLAA